MVWGIRLNKMPRHNRGIFVPPNWNSASEKVASVLPQAPRDYGLARSRWRLQDVPRGLAWSTGISEAGVYKVLKRLGFIRKRALRFIRSPAPDYRLKWQALLHA